MMVARDVRANEETTAFVIAYSLWPIPQQNTLALNERAASTEYCAARGDGLPVHPFWFRRRCDGPFPAQLVEAVQHLLALLDSEPRDACSKGGREGGRERGRDGKGQR